VYSASNNCFDYNDYDLGAVGVVGTTAQQYAMFTNPEYFYGWSSSFRVNYAGRYAGAPVACVTSANSRSSFNSGNALLWNKIVVTCQLSSLANYGTATFYAYSPLVNGNCRLSWCNSVAGGDGSMSGCIIDSISDDSAYSLGSPVLNEIKIIVRNVSGATSSANITLQLNIGFP
jgi:hypothetical protein